MKKYQAANANGKGMSVQVIAESANEAKEKIFDKMSANHLWQELDSWGAGHFQMIAKDI